MQDNQVVSVAFDSRFSAEGCWRRSEWSLSMARRRRSSSDLAGAGSLVVIVCILVAVGRVTWEHSPAPRCCCRLVANEGAALWTVSGN